MTVRVPRLVRPAAEADLGFVLGAWLKQQCTSEEKRELIKAVLARSLAFVACDPSDPDRLLGCTVVQLHRGKPVLHWLYTNNIWRRQGIATELLVHSLAAIGLRYSAYRRASHQPQELLCSAWGKDRKGSAGTTPFDKLAMRTGFDYRSDLLARCLLPE